MKKRLLIAVGLSALLISGCSTKEEAKPAETKTTEAKPALAPQKATEQEVKTTIEHAETKFTEAMKIKAAWRHTKKAINDAKAAMAKGEFDKALKLAKEAYYESDQAIIQSGEAELTWKNATPQAILGIKE